MILAVFRGSLRVEQEQCVHRMESPAICNRAFADVVMVSIAQTRNDLSTTLENIEEQDNGLNDCEENR